jgi:hypothetical protein
MDLEKSAAAAPAAAGGQPTPSPTPVSPGSSAPPTLEDAFGESNPGEPQTDPTPSLQPDAASAADPGQRPADPAKDGAGKTDDSEQPGADALPFDDELGVLTPSVAATSEVEYTELDTPEKIQQAINPDGKLPESEQVKNLLTLVGKHSGEVHKARQVVEQLTPFLARDQRGAVVGFDLAKVFESVGPEAVNAFLEARGEKIVPADFGPEQAGLAKEFPVELVNQMLPATDARYKDLSYEEKVEYIRSDNNLLVDFRLEKRDRDRQAADAKRGATAVANQQMIGRLSEYAQADKGYTALAKRSADGKADSYLDRANADVPPDVSGVKRAELVYKLAKLYRLMDPSVRKDMAGKIRRQVEDELLKKRRLGAPVGGGGAHVAAGVGAGADEAAVWGD